MAKVSSEIIDKSEKNAEMPTAPLWPSGNFKKPNYIKQKYMLYNTCKTVKTKA